MNIKSIETVNKNKRNNTEEFNFYVEVMSNNVAYNIFEFTCTERHEMRLDLVCFDIYENTDFIDLLSNLNNMRNVFDVKKGDIILFIDTNDIQNVSSNESTISSIKDQLKTNNKGKSFKIDNNRQKDTANRKQTEKNKSFVPPNILNSNQSNTTINNGTITLKPNF